MTVGVQRLALLYPASKQLPGAAWALEQPQPVQAQEHSIAQPIPQTDTERPLAQPTSPQVTIIDLPPNQQLLDNREDLLLAMGQAEGPALLASAENEPGRTDSHLGVARATHQGRKGPGDSPPIQQAMSRPILRRSARVARQAAHHLASTWTGSLTTVEHPIAPAFGMEHPIAHTSQALEPANNSEGAPRKERPLAHKPM